MKQSEENMSWSRFIFPRCQFFTERKESFRFLQEVTNLKDSLRKWQLILLKVRIETRFRRSEVWNTSRGRNPSSSCYDDLLWLLWRIRGSQQFGQGVQRRCSFEWRAHLGLFESLRSKASKYRIDEVVNVEKWEEMLKSEMMHLVEEREKLRSTFSTSCSFVHQSLSIIFYTWRMKWLLQW